MTQSFSMDDGPEDEDFFDTFLPRIYQAVAAIAEDLIGGEGSNEERMAEYFAFLEEQQQGTNPHCVDHRLLPRSKRRKFDHARSLSCIMQDYMGPEALYGDGGFKQVFRMTKSRFIKISSDIQASGEVGRFFFLWTMLSTEKFQLWQNCYFPSNVCRTALPLPPSKTTSRCPVLWRALVSVSLTR
jgi:hypothetical protein